MLISANRLNDIWGLRPTTIVHIGAHEAEELADYDRLGWGSVRTVWVDALPEKAEFVRDLTRGRPEQVVVEAVLWDQPGVAIDFNETNNGHSSSALKPKDMEKLYPDIQVTSVRPFITSVASEALPIADLDRIDLVVLDIQGAELRALQGFGDQLDKVQAIYSEVNEREIYEGLALFPEIDRWLSERGFALLDSEVLAGVGWGDAIWVRRGQVPSDAPARRRRRRRRDLPQRVRYFLWWLSRQAFGRR